MKKPSQKDFVLKELRLQGFVTRNWCLQNFISRLSSIMLILKQEGINFSTEHMENGDFKYVLIDKPKNVVYRVNGEVVATKTIW